MRVDDSNTGEGEEEEAAVARGRSSRGGRGKVGRARLLPPSAAASSDGTLGKAERDARAPRIPWWKRCWRGPQTREDGGGSEPGG